MIRLSPIALLAALALSPLVAGCSDAEKETGTSDDAGQGTTDTDATPDDTDDTAPPEDPDGDGDGYDEAAGDCDDADADVHPGATDPVGDTFDQDCDGVDGTDADGDGFVSTASGGDDCDDGAVVISPLATDLSGDGVDQDCDGVDGTDGDGDGVASDVSGGGDCDDADPAVLPGASDTVGDALDANCDGHDGVDADGDAYASRASGGDDCDDGAADLTPADGDFDGASTCAGDCDDADPDRFPANPEACNAVDDDCSLVADYDLAGADACFRSERHAVGTGAVDVLLVIDDSCSMNDEHDLLKKAMDELVTTLDGSDARFGVVSADMSADSDLGQLKTGPDGLLWTDESVPLADRIAWMRETVDVGMDGLDGMGLDALTAALDSSLSGGYNAGFVRDGVDLGVVFASDTTDWSEDVTTAGMASYLGAGWPDPQAVTVHAFAGFQVQCGVEWLGHGKAYVDLAAGFGGIAVEICDVDWQDDMTGMAEALVTVPDDTFVLAEIPDPATIVVTATEPGGAVVVPATPADWIWDPVANAVVLTGYDAPTDTSLAVEYRAAP